jgi:hypothetical protein
MGSSLPAAYSSTPIVQIANGVDFHNRQKVVLRPLSILQIQDPLLLICAKKSGFSFGRD